MKRNSKRKSGTLFLIVGNSGSGKDSLIRWVLQHWPKEIVAPLIPIRVITRPPSPETEDFESVSEDAFQKLSNAGAFTLQWKSYGIHYGVRREIADILNRGQAVLVNVSRQIVEKAQKEFQNVCVIFIKVPFQMTEARIRARGREQGINLEERIERALNNQDLPIADYIVDNSGDLDSAGQQLLNILLQHNSNK